MAAPDVHQLINLRGYGNAKVECAVAGFWDENKGNQYDLVDFSIAQCDFCKKTQFQVKKIITGEMWHDTNRVSCICDECAVMACDMTMENHQ